MTLLRRAARSTLGVLPKRLPTATGGFMGRYSGNQAVNNSVGALNQYGNVGALWGVVNRIAEAVSLVDWNLVKQLPDGTREQVDDAAAPAKHEMTALWIRPNPWMPRQHFLHASDQYMSLAGEVFWLISAAGEGISGLPQSGVKPSMELWPIHPGKIIPVPDPDKYIRGYVYKSGGQSVPIEVQHLVQIVIPDPNNPLRGYGPVQSQLTDLDAERLAAQYNRNVLYNDATPGGVISYPDPINDTDWDRIVMRWREQHQGVSNVARVAMLERGGTWQDVKTTYRDMQWKDMRATNRDNIFLPFGIHGAQMGLAEHINRANAETARADFALWLLKPRLERYKFALNDRVVPFTDTGNEGLAMEYVDPSPEDRAQVVNEAMSLWGWGVHTLNDTLSALGEQPIDGPDGKKKIYELVPNHALPAIPPVPPQVPTTTNAGFQGDEVTKLQKELAEIRTELEALGV